MRNRFIASAVSTAALAAGAAMLGLRGPETPTPRPYPLRVCIVSGDELGSMGEPVVKVYEGREVRLCCTKCAEKFEADKDAAWARIDEQVKTEQRMHYPLETCIIDGRPLRVDGKDAATEFVADNRLVRVCGDACRAEFLKDPAAHAAALDARIAEAQRAGYPLHTCPVGGEQLGSMGEPFELVFENRLVRLCSDGCLEKFHTDPHKSMAALDRTYADSQREGYPLTECVVSGMELGSMGKPAELVAGTKLVRFCCDGCFGQFREDPGKFLATLTGREE